MNIFTPILFVFYLQVMPPPPPGGSEYQSLRIVRNSDGSNIKNINIENVWWPMEKAVRFGDCLPGTAYCDYFSILEGMEKGYIKITKSNEVWFMW